MQYTSNDIISLSAGKAFREKIGMYLSADRQEAINLGLRELIVNAQDEYEVFKPKNPRLSINLNTKTREITVADNMRGIPVGLRDDGINSLTAAFLIPHSGGKHNEGVYSSAVGVNGEGMKIVCHTAEYLTVEVLRDEKKYSQSFKASDEGALPITEVLEEEVRGKETGTSITYKPDSKVYGDIFIDIEGLEKMLVELSYFTVGLEIKLIVDGKEKTFLSKNGLLDGLDTTNALSKPFSFHYENDECKVELALQWVSKKGEIKGYANGLHMPDGGAFISSFKSSLTRTFNNLNKSKYTGDQIREILDGYVSVKVRVGQFSNQAKTALANKEAGTATSTAITTALKEYQVRHKEEFERVIELLSKLSKAEAAAEKARQTVMNYTKDIANEKKKKVLLANKLKDAEHLGEDSILLIVEGDSAAGSMSVGRDTKKFGILPIRGKMINCLSNSEDKYLGNEEVKAILVALGININNYNSSQLRYGKLAIAVDGDVDGGHIACLIITFLYKLAPQFLTENRLCWLKAPLYKVMNGGKEHFYYNDTELKNGVKGATTRFKGLGELSAPEVKRSMFGEFQRLEELDFDGESAELIEQLMGSDVQPRKDFIFNNIDFSIYQD